MKTTGLVRRMWSDGNVKIPIEIRSRLGICDGDSLEIFMDGDSVCFRKYRPLALYGGITRIACRMAVDAKVKIAVYDTQDRLTNASVGGAVDFPGRPRKHWFGFQEFKVSENYYVCPIQDCGELYGFVVSEKDIGDSALESVRMIARYMSAAIR